MKSDDFTEEGPYLVTGSDFKGPEIDWKECYHCDLSRYEQDPYIQLKEGDLLITKDGTIGKVALVRRLDGKATLNSGVFVVRPIKDSYTSRFYFWLLQSSVFTGFVDFNKTGSTIVHLYQDTFVNFRYALPRVNEQTQIANFLDRETAKIDALIEKQQRLIALLKEKRQAVISHAVTKGLAPNAPMKDSGVEWLGEVPAHWEVKKFSHCASIRNGQVDPTKEPYCNFTLVAPNHIESGTGRLIKCETAAEQGADSGKYLCKKGEVIYSKIRPALAKVCIAPSDDTICSADMYPIKGCSGLTNKFLFWTLLSNWFTSLVVLESDRVAMPKINREKLAEVSIPVPPALEQREIVDEIADKTETMDRLIVRAKMAIELARERRTALISAAVTGKIDVRDFQQGGEAA
ncbi:restriction endonuclease subunit S [Gilvimarinus sp. 2_MG-2023]|uniref:restriction endonuclease subunit S n=1 Tax=Gilvimarinus sp. 2_MG-2023 TaxID=3062666 RepID=UPI0026E43E0A|nr:restriction endonuclease subunit S [Gilvimarinus sp. 2_MG-2023]MDO6572130.1 restriction endonuclease subunit S [Gilvimarinus sp. 2_MG-2023]